MVDGGQVISSDEIYPLLASDLIKSLGINQHVLKCFLWKFKIKEDKRYHHSIKTGKKSVVHKYSRKVLDLFNRYKDNEEFVKNMCDEYAAANSKKKEINNNHHNIYFNFKSNFSRYNQKSSSIKFL